MNETPNTTETNPVIIATDRDDAVEVRRSFLGRMIGAVAGTMALATAYVRTIASEDTGKKSETAPKQKTQYAMLIDVRKCIGCHACTVACKSEGSVPLGVNRSWVEYVEKGVYPNVGRSFLPRLCNHCSEPPCVRVCPTDATYKRQQDGIVAIDEGLCIGCKYCILACPYDARFLNPVTGWADKCDFCAHRVARGLVPSCVNTCVGGARIFGDIGDPLSDISRLLAENRVTVLRNEMGTFPNVYYIGADYTDEIDANRVHLQSVHVITHRPKKERR